MPHKAALPKPKSEDGWLVENMGHFRVLIFLVFSICGMRFLRDFPDENGVVTTHIGTVVRAWCHDIMEQMLETMNTDRKAKLTLNIDVTYPDGDKETLNLEHLTKCWWAVRPNDRTVSVLMTGVVIESESGKKGVVRVFDLEQEIFLVVVQDAPLTAYGFEINEVLMSLQEVMICLIRHWQSEFGRLVGIEIVFNPLVTAEQKEANILAEMEAQRTILNGSKPFFKDMYRKQTENRKAAREARREAKREATMQINKAAKDATAAAVFEQKEKEECTMCWEERRSHVLIPCGHIILCEGCVGKVLNDNNLCPFCRAVIESTNRVHLP